MMFLFRVLQHPLVCFYCRNRTYATKTALSIAEASSAPSKKLPPGTPAPPRSSCAPDTLLTGVNYLKSQPPVLALPDDEYPEWLWTILQPKVWPDDGPGGKAERVKRRHENRQRIKDQNFMKTQ